MSSSGAVVSPPLSVSGSSTNGDSGVMEKASLEVNSVDSTSMPQGPAKYEVTYTRGGWIWETSHRFRDWLRLKDSLKQEFETRDLPDDSKFPKKEDVAAIVTKLLSSCEGCRQSDGPVGILEERRQGLQAYFSEILVKQREIWDRSDDIKRFFFPGPPTRYSAALARRRSDEIKEERNKGKEAPSTGLSLSSTLKSFKFSSIFESTPSPTLKTTAAPPIQGPLNAPSEESMPSTHSTSILDKISAKMPTLRDVFFDSTSSSKTSSRHGNNSISNGASSRHSGIHGSQHSSTGGFGRPQRSSSINKPRSESGTTDPDGISDTGGSKHSMWD